MSCYGDIVHAFILISCFQKSLINLHPSVRPTFTHKQPKLTETIQNWAEWREQLDFLTLIFLLHHKRLASSCSRCSSWFWFSITVFSFWTTKAWSSAHTFHISFHLTQAMSDALLTTKMASFFPFSLRRSETHLLLWVSQLWKQVRTSLIPGGRHSVTERRLSADYSLI